MKKLIKNLILLATITFFLIGSCKERSTCCDPTQKPVTTTTNSNATAKIIVTTLAGSGSIGSANGVGTAASFFYPNGLSVDALGNIYVGDVFNNMIRKITSNGVVTTVAGSGSYGKLNGIGTAASFWFPYGVVVDDSDNIYVGDHNNNLIRKINSSGVVSTFAGTGTSGSTNGISTSASFFHCQGLAIDASGNLYIADTGNHLIRKITPTGIVSTVAGTAGVAGNTNGTGTAASFNYPSSIAIDASGNLYVADSFNNLIRKIDPSGVVTTLAGSGAVGSTNAIGIAASFNQPSGVAIDASGNLYVADSYNNLIRKIDPLGAVTTLAGTGSIGSTNGDATVASFNYPCSVAVDASGNVYVGDHSNNMIRKITQ
ncbi:MAG TPA: NHL repeat-containing protein [Cytophagaceae bacterium]|jgi:serine/threonine-protein kinase|nr:NHL repeat-containing protein [Cytophagaceae bacterium]